MSNELTPLHVNAVIRDYDDIQDHDGYLKDHQRTLTKLQLRKNIVIKLFRRRDT